MEPFVIIVSGFQSLTIITKFSILDVAVSLDLPMKNATFMSFFNGVIFDFSVFSILIFLGDFSYNTKGIYFKMVQGF